MSLDAVEIFVFVRETICLLSVIMPNAQHCSSKCYLFLAEDLDNLLAADYITQRQML